MADPTIIIGIVVGALALVIQYFIIKGAVLSAIREARADKPTDAENAPPVP